MVPNLTLKTIRNYILLVIITKKKKKKCIPAKKKRVNKLCQSMKDENLLKIENRGADTPGNFR